MSEFEFMFVIDPIGDDVERSLTEELEAFVGGHGRTTILTLSATGPDPVATAQSSIADLRQRGVRVRRVYEDLVSRAQIAERAQVTRQAVGLWVRAERQTERSFPEPYVLAGGGLWRWDEVNSWLRDANLPHDDVKYLNASETALINVWLTARTSNVDVVYGGTRGRASVVLAHSTATTHRGLETSDWLSAAADSKRTDFALGA
ncbi:hypothetical protein [Phycicoccus flavus]|uniref:hypothetical protein n=1 Tax=Phycicoccus flavus TaxID=2502783 RepID=UPI000FEBE109|nr:hypothetical protein [Phycicoccus flavus]NHA68224.1 hypothetical protein [Phycicoccus flavus]